MATTTKIILRDQTAVLPASVVDIIAPILSPRLPSNSNSGKSNGGVRFWRRGRDGRLLVRPKLGPRVKVELMVRGYQVRVIDKRLCLNFAVADVNQIPGSGSACLQDILWAATESLHGQIAIEKPGDVVEVLLGLARLYHRERVLVVVKNRESARRLAERLHSQVDVPVTSSDYQWRDGPQIHVDNMVSFIGRNAEDWRVVIVADLESAVAKTVIDQVSSMLEARVYAITPAGHRFDYEDQLRLETLCGPEIYRQRDDASALTNVEVCWLAAASYPPDDRRDFLKRKRRNIWHNDQRNQRIADAAHCLRTLDGPGLRVLGMDQAATVQTFLQSAQPPRVHVLVETPEHARALHKVLPGWKVFDTTSVVPDELELPLDVDLAIVTIPRAYAQGVAADVVIRAAGTEHAWKSNYGPHAMYGGHLLIVDLLDDFDLRAKKDAQRRWRDYEERGWTTAGAVLL